jgi:hypothetical protein
MTTMPVIFAQTAQIQTYQMLLDMQPNALFQTLTGPNTTVLTGLRSLMQMFGAVFLILGHAERAKSDQANGQAAWVGLIKTVVLTALMFGGGQVLGFIAAAMNSVPASIGLPNDTPHMISALYERGVQMPSFKDIFEAPTGVAAADSATLAGALHAGTTADSGDPSVPSTSTASWWSKAKAWMSTQITNLSPTQLMQSAAGFFARVLIALRKAAESAILLACICVVVVFSMLLIWIMEAVRYVCLLIGACLLPLFIGFISTQKMREAGWRYVTQMIAIASWPLGWAVCNTVTLVLFDMSVGLIFGGTGYANASTLVGEMTTPGQSVAWADFSSAAMTASPMATWVGIGLLFFTFVWMIFSAIMAPILITKTLTTGQEFTFGAMQSNAQVSSEVAGKAAQMAAQAALML